MYPRPGCIPDLDIRKLLSSEKHFCHWEISKILIHSRGLDLWWLRFQLSLPDCLYREKVAGGGLCHGHISHLVWIWLIDEQHQSIISKNTGVRRNRTRKKQGRKISQTPSPTALEILKKIPGKWQIPLVVTSPTWLVNLTSWLDNLTWQVDLSPCPLAPLQITCLFIICQVDLSSQLEPLTVYRSNIPFKYIP